MSCWRFIPWIGVPCVKGKINASLMIFPAFPVRIQKFSVLARTAFFSHKAWADSLDLKHKLLADMHRTVCKSYGLYFDALNCAKRATVIVDKQGRVAYVKVQEIKVPRDDKDNLEALKKLN